MLWLWLGIAILLSLPIGIALLLAGLHYYICWKYLHDLMRIFQEKPLFICPRGEPKDGAEDVRFLTADGLRLRGCYLKTAQPRRGVILFGLEYGSNRWACRPYCESLLQAGYDVFAFEPRNQGDSDKQPEYAPLQWVTDRDLADTRAAIAYLKKRPDADPRGIGFFGISKGASVGLLAAASEPYVRCLVTDGAFGTYATMVPYMRRWVSIYSDRYLLHELLPAWYYRSIAKVGVRRTGRERNVRFLDVEKALPKLRRPVLMVHGSGDTYIKVHMARALYDRLGGWKDFWVVEGAKHNQALAVAGAEYHRRVCAFFDEYLAAPAASAVPVETPLPAPALSVQGTPVGAPVPAEGWALATRFSPTDSSGVAPLPGRERGIG